MTHSKPVVDGLAKMSCYLYPTVADLERLDRALKRILRACAESAERYDHLDVEEREAEVGRLRNDVIVEVCRARRAMGMTT